MAWAIYLSGVPFAIPAATANAPEVPARDETVAACVALFDHGLV